MEIDFEELKEKIKQLSEEQKKEVSEKVKEKMAIFDLGEILRKHLGDKND